METQKDRQATNLIMLRHGLHVLVALAFDGALEREDLCLEGLELRRDLVAVRRAALVGDLNGQKNR